MREIIIQNLKGIFIGYLCLLISFHRKFGKINGATPIHSFDIYSHRIGQLLNNLLELCHFHPSVCSPWSGNDGAMRVAVACPVMRRRCKGHVQMTLDPKVLYLRKVVNPQTIITES